MSIDRLRQPCHAREMGHPSPSNTYRLRVSANGRLVLPAPVRQQLGIKPGDELLVTQDETGIRIATVTQRVREVQAFFADLGRPGHSIVDELIRERREEAAREEDHDPR